MRNWYRSKTEQQTNSDLDSRHYFTHSRIFLIVPTSLDCSKPGNQLSGKIPENIAKLLFYQKTHGARRRDGEGPRGAHTTWWRGPGQAALGGGVAALVSSSTSPSSYK